MNSICLLTGLCLALAGDAPRPLFYQYLTERPAPSMVAFNPSEYDPRQKAPNAMPATASLADDLAALRYAFDGLILYAYDKDLTPRILETAKGLKYRAVLLGVYTLSEEELVGTAELVKQYRKDLALAVVLGNEGIAFNRYNETDLERARKRFDNLLSPEDRVPTTTSEPLTQYGMRFLQDFGDFLCPNIHPGFDARELGPHDAALWARQRALDLATALDRNLLVKETGFPHSGDPRFNTMRQAEFWTSYVQKGLIENVPGNPRLWVSHAAAFEAFDLKWKAKEPGLEIEGAWGLMNPWRQPYSAFEAWRAVREYADWFPLRAGGPEVIRSNHLLAAQGFLDVQMDRWNPGTQIYAGRSSQVCGFYPSNWDGDVADVKLDESIAQVAPNGTEPLAIVYVPKGAKKWFALTFAYPDIPNGNWGQAKGRDLTNAMQLRGWIRGERGGEVVEVLIGGINTDKRPGIERPFADPYKTKRQLTLGKGWQHFVLEIPPRSDLRSVIGGFTLAASAAANPQGINVQIAGVAYDDLDPDRLRLISSYTWSGSVEDDLLRSAAYVYDNAIAILQYLAQHTEEGDRRAMQLARALVWAQVHDRAAPDQFRPWRSAYASYPLDDAASNSARLPGVYDPKFQRMKEDRYAISLDVGNQSFCILALLAAHRRFEAGKIGPHPFLRAAIAAGKWIEAECRANDPWGGYTGGFEGWEKNEQNQTGPQKLQWRSTEHAIDCYAAMAQIGHAVYMAASLDPARWSDPKHTPEHWYERADHAKQFVLRMWDARGYFAIGLRNEAGVRNEDAVALDVQVWSIMALGHDPDFQQTIGWKPGGSPPVMLDWIKNHCGTTLKNGATAFRFSDHGTGIWPEGMCQVAACWSMLGDKAKAEELLNQVAAWQDLNGGIPAAVGGEAETGLLKDFGKDDDGKPIVKKWIYPSRPHVGATAWFQLASSKTPNVYWTDGVPSELATPDPANRPKPVRRGGK